ncbi:MAG: threonine synthase [Actinomycetota bacterium]
MSSRLVDLQCARCGSSMDAFMLQNRCECGGTLLPRYDLSAPVSLDEVRARPPGPWRYQELLPLQGPPVSLGEVETPLLFCERLSDRFGVETWIKDDAPLPGSTFKARGACVGLSRALELGVDRVVMPSAGNAGGAWSLYAARAGVEITVTMSVSAPDFNKAEVTLAGGKLELVEGTIADAGARAKELAESSGAWLATTFNEPYRVDGKKTAWLELFDRLGDEASMTMPGSVILPVGGGVAAIALAKAAREVTELGWSGGPAPAIVGVQSADCAPIVRAFDAGADEVAPWETESTSRAAGLRVPAPSEGWLVLREVRASGGSMQAASEEAIRSAVGDLASTEGVFACPEGAATLVAAEGLARDDALRAPVVLYSTGAGAKYLELLE